MTNVLSLPLYQLSHAVQSNEDWNLPLTFVLADGVTAFSLAGIAFTAEFGGYTVVGEVSGGSSNILTFFAPDSEVKTWTPGVYALTILATAPDGTHDLLGFSTMIVGAPQVAPVLRQLLPIGGVVNTLMSAIPISLASVVASATESATEAAASEATAVGAATAASASETAARDSETAAAASAAASDTSAGLSAADAAAAAASAVTAASYGTGAATTQVALGQVYQTKALLTAAQGSLANGLYLVWADWANLTHNGLYSVTSHVATQLGTGATAGANYNELTRLAVERLNTVEDNRTLGALKNVTPLWAAGGGGVFPFVTILAAGATYWNGTTSSGAIATSGGLRIPQGQTGAASSLQVRTAITAAQAANMAGRTARFVLSLATSSEWIAELTVSTNQNTALAVTFSEDTGQSTGAIGMTRVRRRDATHVAVELDYTFVGAEAELKIVLTILNSNEASAADCTAFATAFQWFALDDNGTSDAFAGRLLTAPVYADDLLTAVAVRNAGTLIAGAVFEREDRGFTIPAGSSGAASAYIVDTPVHGIPAGTVVVLEWTFTTTANFTSETTLAATGIINFFDTTTTALVTKLFQDSATQQRISITYTMLGGETYIAAELLVSNSATSRVTKGTVELTKVAITLLQSSSSLSLSKILADYERGLTVQRMFVPKGANVVLASPRGDADYVTVREAVAAAKTGASFAEPQRVTVAPGTYTNECAVTPGGVASNTETVLQSDYVNVYGGNRASTIIKAWFGDDQANQSLIQPIWLQRSAVIEGLTVDLKNGRYPIHVESGGSVDYRAVQEVRDCHFEHRGATGWASPTAVGIGQHAGEHQRFKRIRAISTTQAFSFHNGPNWFAPSELLAEDCHFIATTDEGHCIAVISEGAGIMSSATFRNCTLGGFLNYQTSFLSMDLLANHRGNRYEHNVVLDSCSPCDWVSACQVDVLELDSAAGAGSDVSLSGSAVLPLFGLQPVYREGGVGYAARVYSYHALSVVSGETDPGVALSARLGNLVSSPLSLSIAFDGGAAVTISLDQDYSAMVNADVVTNLNSKLSAAMSGSTGGRQFLLSQPYANRAPVTQPGREGYAKNADATAILKGHALAWSGRQVRLMTSSDPAASFAGIAMDEAMVGRPCRFQRTGWLGSPHVLFTGTPSVTAGSTWQVDASNPGQLVSGSATPILLCRTTQSYGATMELIQSGAP